VKKRHTAKQMSDLWRSRKSAKPIASGRFGSVECDVKYTNGTLFVCVRHDDYIREHSIGFHIPAENVKKAAAEYARVSPEVWQNIHDKLGRWPSDDEVDAWAAAGWFAEPSKEYEMYSIREPTGN
jgi:hypothetical protein